MEHVCAGLRRGQMLLEMDDRPPHPRVWRLFRVSCTPTSMNGVITMDVRVRICPGCGQKLPPWPDCPPSLVVVT